jgi:hypothetical protein
MPNRDLTKRTRRQHKDDYRESSRPRENQPSEAITKKEPDVVATESQLVPTALDAHRRDVFAVYPIEVRGINLEALDEQLRLTSSEELILELTAGVRHPILCTTFRVSLQDPGLFTCFLAVSRTFYEQRRSETRFQPSNHLLDLQAQGLSSVRDRIMKEGAENNDGLIASILQLMVVASVSGNMRSVVSHQRGTRKLIAMRTEGTNQALYQTSMGILMVIEFYMALIPFLTPGLAGKGGIRTTENPLRYVKHPFPSTLCIRISALPNGLQDLILTSHISVQTIDLLEKVTAWSMALDGVASGAESTDEAYGTLFSAPMECSRSAVFILKHLRQSNRQFTIEYILSLGITIVIKHQRNIKKVDHLDDQLLDAFIDAVRQFASPTAEERETLIWLGAVVSWRTAAAFTSRAQALVSHILQALEPPTISDIQRIWTKFLWHKRFMGHWTRHWQAGLDRRQELKHAISPAQVQAHASGKARSDCVFAQGVAEIKKEDSTESNSSNSTGQLSLVRSVTTSSTGSY